jgi:hypothetical protein
MTDASARRKNCSDHREHEQQHEGDHDSHHRADGREQHGDAESTHGGQDGPQNWTATLPRDSSSASKYSRSVNLNRLAKMFDGKVCNLVL